MTTTVQPAEEISLIKEVDVHLTIKRFNPETDVRPHWREYDLKLKNSDTVLNALIAVKSTIDGTLSFRRSCAHGVCGSDAMMINGENRLGCVNLISTIGTDLVIEPVRGLPVIKDLVVDMEPFFAQYRSVLPYLIANDDPGYKERYQSPEDRARFDDTTKCILCGACSTSCPVYWANGTYIGPAAIVNAHRFIFDSRDQAKNERLDILNQKSGVWRCRTSFNCTEACPRGIKVTEAIEEVKRAILYDRS
ncbi:succinate dehydrogenase iron-sulfur subunit [Ferrimicrobium sp.]|uniref:succinate dehydrogenase iron-sulfur subunit n=1 Tax=Ferrimicrobium sp. TaxID=2926050 RepID=UPI00261A5184|nr:succinate dehydrogenase iron-sulfur subunit [Ferrimicrobium sp.]